MIPLGALHTLRDITNATNQRTIITAHVPASAVGHSAWVIGFERHEAVASLLMAANLNSLPLDWAARFKVPGVHASSFILKQLPALTPDAYLTGRRPDGETYAALVVPRALELVYVSREMQAFAQALGCQGPPFRWDGARRHVLQSELDAVYACMYALDRDDLAWILDAGALSVSFPGLKQQEMQAFGEYRTRRLVLDAYDCLARYGTL